MEASQTAVLQKTHYDHATGQEPYDYGCILRRPHTTPVNRHGNISRSIERPVISGYLSSEEGGLHQFKPENDVNSITIPDAHYNLNIRLLAFLDVYREILGKYHRDRGYWFRQLCIVKNIQHQGALPRCYFRRLG